MIQVLLLLTVTLRGYLISIAYCLFFILPVTIRKRFSLLQTTEGINFRLVRMYVCDSLIVFLDNIYIRFGNKLYRQIVGIPMGTNSAALVAALFLIWYERDFMISLSDDNSADIIENLTQRLDI